MLLRQATLTGIQKGTITQSFRKWKRPTVKAGGTLVTRIGLLSIHVVDKINLEDLTEKDAMEAGYSELGALLSELENRPEGQLYRIRFELTGPDPRIALREMIPVEAELGELLKKLSRMDARSATGPWTQTVLEMIRQRPAERAGNLAADFGQEKLEFKARVRRLKALGFTESLSIGYKLSPRGVAVLKQMDT